MLVTSVQQHSRRAWREPFLDTNRVWQTDRHVALPASLVKPKLHPLPRRIAPVGDDAVRRHRPPPQFHGGIALLRWKPGDALGVRRRGKGAALREVRRLPIPA